MEPKTKTCCPIPGGLILTHSHVGSGHCLVGDGPFGAVLPMTREELWCQCGQVIGKMLEPLVGQANSGAWVGLRSDGVSVLAKVLKSP